MSETILFINFALKSFYFQVDFGKSNENITAVENEDRNELIHLKAPQIEPIDFDYESSNDLVENLTTDDKSSDFEAGLDLGNF